MELLNARNTYLNEVEALMTRCNSKLESLVTSIGWTMESLTRHVKNDELNDDSELPDPPVEVKIEAPVSENKDLEKLYNDLLKDLPNQLKKPREKSEAEMLVDLLELERNMKRRRISYKNKVHTKNKSHTEVLRALVGEQMKVLSEIAGTDITDEGTEEKCSEDKESDDVGLINLGYPRGNPYTVWQKIEQVVQRRNLNETDSKPKDESGYVSVLRMAENKKRDSHSHRSDQRHHFDNPGSSSRYRSEHDDRYHRPRHRSGFDSDRSKSDKLPRRSPVRSHKHKRRSHRSRSHS